MTSAACELPSELPRGWDTEFQIELEGTTLSVAELLPREVRVTEDLTAFTLDLASVEFSESLLSLCPACAAAHGSLTPKPAFQSTFTGSMALPSDVLSVELESGQVRVTLTNHLDFDPLRPSASARGSLTLRLRSAATELGAPLLIDGNAVAFPPRSTIVRLIALDRATLSGPIAVDVTVDSPAGDPAPMDGSGELMAAAAPEQLRIRSASVVVASKQVQSVETRLDLSEVDASSQRVKRGSLLLTLVNPFNVTGTVNVRFTAPEVDVAKQLQIATGTSERVLTVTREDLGQILGKEVVVRISGALSGPPGGVTVTADQVLSVRSRLHVVIGPSE